MKVIPMTREEKEDEIRRKFRVWFKKTSFSVDDWLVQRKTWYGTWKTIAKSWDETDALKIKKILIKEEIETFNFNRLNEEDDVGGKETAIDAKG